MAAGADIDATAGAAVRFLLDARDPDGGWRDYELPVGVSDAWVTAHVAAALACATASGLAGDPTSVAVAEAVKHLAGLACAEGAWGFNATAGPDADTTALTALLLLGRAPVPDRTWAFLREHARPGGGFATFEGPGAWGHPHPCVTPVVALALVAAGQAGVRESALGYVGRTRRADGTWPAYWWRGSHYATFWNLLFLRAAGTPIAPLRPALGGRPSEDVRSTLDIACVAGILTLRLGAGEPALRLAALLRERQRRDGGWDGAADLRVTHHDCAAPWEEPEGATYVDLRGLLTTAMCLRVLALMARSAR